MALGAQLRSLPGPQLILVRYSPNHDPLLDWVYNEADIESAEGGLGPRYGSGKESRAALLLQRPGMVAAGRGSFFSATCVVCWRSRYQSHRGSVGCARQLWRESLLIGCGVRRFRRREPDDAADRMLMSREMYCFFRQFAVSPGNDELLSEVQRTMRPIFALQDLTLYSVVAKTGNIF